VLYKVIANPDGVDVLALLKRYFRLETCLKDLYKQWSSDKNFKRKAESVIGLRLLDQDSTENIFSFICSSNNNISRIKGMVQNLALTYGRKVGTINGVDFYSFPSAADMAVDGTEAKLRELGFGYRAAYIYKSACHIKSNPSYLPGLKTSSDIKAQLIILSGVGPKVADCIQLMSQGQMHIVPVDTHVLQIAQRDYKCPVKTVTKLTYNQVSSVFVKVFGELAGWAHCILFFSDLKPSKPKVDAIDTKVKVEEGIKVKKIELMSEEPETTELKKESSAPETPRSKRARMRL
jgi:N-glycosylase/DNA lyase